MPSWPATGQEAEAEFEKMVQYQMEKVGTREAAIEEVVANTVPVILTDVEQGKRFAEEVMHSTSKVKAWFEQLLKDLREILDKAYNILKGQESWKQMEIVRNDKATIDMIADFYFEGMKGTKGKAANESSVKHSLKEFSTDGKRFVEIDQEQDRFDGHDVSEYPRIAKDIINEKFVGKVVGLDNKMFVNGHGRDEYAHSSKHIFGDIYNAKMRAAGELDNLLDAGTNFRSKPDGADGHIHSDAIGGFSYFDTLFKIGDKWFSGTVNIKNIKRGSLFTDVTKIKDVTKDIVNSYGESPKFHFLRTSSIDNVPQNPENVKRFSMKDAVEATDDLIAVHNLDRKGLEGALELGGFPMPSIAITKSDMGHTKFGDISVIFGRDTIDPAANKANMIYGHDAFTPTFPKIGIKPNEKIVRRILDLRDEAIENEDVYFSNYGNSIYNSLIKLLEKYNGNEERVVDSFIDDTDMMQAYLVDQGKQPIATVWEEKINKLLECEKAEYDAIIKAVGKKAFSELGSTGTEFQAWDKKYGDAFASAIKQYRIENGGDADRIESYINRFVRHRKHQPSRVRDYLRTGGEVEKLERDMVATRRAILDAVNLEEYRAWLKELFSGIVEKRGVHNPMYDFTYDDYRDNFGNVFWEYNLENIVKSMMRQRRRGA